MAVERHDVDQSVLNRYSNAAGAREAELCCPVEYDQRYLEPIPQEILERDYGCGDPSRHVRQGDTVLDLGSGGGKICYIASQIVGPTGRVIGVDMNDEMLELAESYREEFGNRVGHHNVEFHKGKIQDLALDVRALDKHLEDHALDPDQIEAWKQRQRQDCPLIAADSVDVIVSNCVLNLVREDDRDRLFSEIFRVLRRGGRAVISDIVSDETVSEEMKNDPTLWSGCISGAFREDRFLQAFERAGFNGTRLLNREETPWRTVQGIEFRSVTVEAFKGEVSDAPCCGREDDGS
jgi:ubiquinone/menaquinone biosynthesis C-methylase UbiE